MKANRWIFLSGLYALLLAYMGYAVPRHEHLPLMLGFATLLALGYFLAKTKLPLSKVILIGLIFRLLLLWATPQLSDDYHRFLWDGKLLLEGSHPFAYTPREYLSQVDQPSQALVQHFEQLNSPDYYSIYPPIHQMVFAAGAWAAQADPHYGVLAMRLLLLLFEWGSLALIAWLLRSYRKPSWWLGLYAFHPLVILEISGNLHLEGVMLFFMLLALALYPLKQAKFAGIALGMSIATKLLPLMSLPAWLLTLPKRQKISFALLVILTSLLLFAPLLNLRTLLHMSQSLQLYFQSFEFNPSLYAIVRWLGYQMTGYNQIAWIGPALSLLSGAAILFLSFRYKHRPLVWQFSMIWLLYLAFATTVHPWYLIPLLAFGILSGLRFPLLWSALVFLSYMQYGLEEVKQMPWLWFLEYSLVAVALVVDLRKPNLPFPFGQAH